jgi:hypothetical protein
VYYDLRIDTGTNNVCVLIEKHEVRFETPATSARAAGGSQWGGLGGSSLSTSFTSFINFIPTFKTSPFSYILLRYMRSYLNVERQLAKQSLGRCPSRRGECMLHSQLTAWLLVSQKPMNGYRSSLWVLQT